MFKAFLLSVQAIYPKEDRFTVVSSNPEVDLWHCYLWLDVVVINIY